MVSLSGCGASVFWLFSARGVFMLGNLFACFGNVEGKEEGRKKVLPYRRST
jgi:hypothetical protein